jgi:hypothetical protein
LFQNHWFHASIFTRPAPPCPDERDPAGRPATCNL